jgi:hypothetical protein
MNIFGIVKFFTFVTHICNGVILSHVFVKARVSNPCQGEQPECHCQWLTLEIIDVIEFVETGNRGRRKKNRIVSAADTLSVLVFRAAELTNNVRLIYLARNHS